MAHPPPARVPGNLWDQLDVPELGTWTPAVPVTVVVPHYESPRALSLTLSALARQTYPRELLQVLVVDDGSPTAPRAGEELGDLDVDVLVQQRRGFGAGRARNLGASVAKGDILLFVDSDMVAEPHLVEAHARWHSAASDAVTLGFRSHVDFGGIDPTDVRRAALGG